MAEHHDDNDLWADELDDEAWDEAERYWRAEADRLAAEAGQAGEWPSWEPRIWGDGITPIERRDRSSLCDGRSNTIDRAFQIIQHRAHADGPCICAWVKDYEHDELWNEDAWPRFPKTMLVITLCLSDATAEVARSLLRRWMDPTTSAADMKVFIDDTLAGGSG